MAKSRWHIKKEGETLTLARQLPARFDVACETLLADSARLSIAHQLRQDMWRALQHLRGFSPVVQVTRSSDGLLIKAGGRVEGTFSREAVNAQITDLLNTPSLRQRWVQVARHKSKAATRGGAHV